VRRIAVEPRFEAWRDAARGLLAEGVPPEALAWIDTAAPEQGLLLDLAPPVPEVFERPESPAEIRIPRQFLELARAAACHRDPGRWELLYRLLWRLSHGEPHLLEVEVDEDVRRLVLLEKAVRRDSHKMKAFVRFRRIEDANGADHGERWIAWHRPDHRIVERVAPFFVDRFGSMRWSILTPDTSAHWDGEDLTFAPGLPQAAAPAEDRLEDLWRTYYKAIFNPARIKLKAMRAELPVRHWATLPETRVIPDLLRAAPSRVEAMIASARRPTVRDFIPPGTPEDATGLPILAEAVQGCAACTLCESATRAVFGEGPVDAAVAFVGEQPGDQEDLVGRPFVGPAGQVLDEALAEVGLSRGAIYLTNAVKHFKWEPRGKRRIHKTPTLGEVTACRPWLEEEIGRVRPRVLVALGGTAARSLLGPTVRLREARGQVFTDTPWAPRLIVTWHPSALLRMPEGVERDEARRQLVEDLRKVLPCLDGAEDGVPRLHPVDVDA
jgi:probable DNA metabolism protein